MSEETERGATDDDVAQRRRASLSGMRARRRLRDVPEVRRREWIERGLDLGLQAAPSIRDRDISLFSRGMDPQFAGINTFARMPYVRIRTIGQHDVAVVGVPFDMGRRIAAGHASALMRSGGSPVCTTHTGPTWDGLPGGDLIGDAGDVFVIPANLEKSFDQIAKAVSQSSTQAHPSHPRRRPLDRLPDLRRCRPARRWERRDHPLRPAPGHPGEGRWTSGCTPARGTTPRSAERLARRTSCRSASAAGAVPRRAPKSPRDRETTVFTVDDVVRLGVERVDRDGAGDRVGRMQGGVPELRHRLHRMRAASPEPVRPSPAACAPARP